MLPLHLAAGKGHLPLLPLLFSSALEKGDADGATALWRAAQKGQLEAAAWWMRMMMQCGTSPVISWFINPINYRYIYHKSYLL